MIKISIIIPVYNTANYLEQCLNSIVNQTYKNIEIILINDGSTDGSDVICEAYSRQDDRIKYYSKENEGQGKARNLGIEMSTGEYVMFVDSDDFIELNAVEKFLEYMKNLNADICGFDYYSYDDNLGNCNQVQCVRHDVTYSIAVDVINNKEALAQMSPVLCTKVIRRELLNRVSICMKNYMCEDLLFLAQLYVESNKISQVHYAGYYYRCSRPGNLSTKLSKYEEVKKVVEELVEVFNKKGLREVYWKELYQLSFNIYKDFLFRLSGKRKLLDSINIEYFNRFLEEYYESLRKLFSNKIQIDMLQKKYVLIGSYNLRTLIHTILLEENKLIGDYSMSAIESIMSKNTPCSIANEMVLMGDNGYRRRQIRQDTEKLLQNSEALKMADVIIIDLIDEVNGIMILNDNTILTDSKYFPNQKIYAEENNVRYIDFLDEERDEYFFEAAKQFAEMLKKFNSQILIVENYYCDSHTASYDERTKYITAEKISEINLKLKNYYKYLENLIPNAKVITDRAFEKYRFTSDDWPFGTVPYYYNNSYNRYMAIEICKEIQNEL